MLLLQDRSRFCLSSVFEYWKTLVRIHFFVLATSWGFAKGFCYSQNLLWDYGVIKLYCDEKNFLGSLVDTVKGLKIQRRSNVALIV